MKNIAKIRGSGESADGHVRNSGNGRLSKEHLRDLRNKISIRGLIENELGVRCHTESGVFRFECPGCGSFHTSVMKNRNLARCFGCETNFNPIGGSIPANIFRTFKASPRSGVEWGHILN